MSKSARLIVLALGLLQSPGIALAAEEPTSPSAEVEPEQPSRWFARIGILGALYHSRATIATYGNVIPGATARVTNNVTMIFDLGYDVTDSFSLMLMGGLPPRPAVIGQGAVSSYGTLGAVRYGPVFLTGVYRFPERNGLRTYAGGGVAHAIILRAYDGSVTQLKVHDNWGFALQAGIEYRLNRKWDLFIDYKRLWLDVKAEGLLGIAPVRARVTLDPDLVSAGVKFHFG